MRKLIPIKTLRPESAPLPGPFTSEVTREAESLALREAEIMQKESATRRDFREVPTITIDPKDAKDFDDALSHRTLGNGLHEVGIHIADVSYFVTPHTAIDKEAHKR